jgi:acyl-CoA synthetase (AMP-forming)/AMP-acid ligase II
VAGESFHAGFEDLRRRDGKAPAVLDMDGGARLSRDDLARQIDRAAAVVRDVAPAGGVVPAWFGNSAALVAIVFASWREGRIPMPIDRERSEAEVAAISRSLGARGVVCDTSWTVRPIEGNLATPIPRDTAVLKLTSGSTGEPRAVAVSESALARGVAQIVSTMGLRAEDRNLVTLPLAHSYAFDNVIGVLATLGAPAVLLGDLIPRRLRSVLAESGVTVWPAVPLLLDVLSRSSARGAAVLGSLRLVISAGAPLPAAVREAFAKRFGLRPRTFYGATECGGITFDRVGEADLPDGCVGTPLDGVRVDLVDEHEGVGRVRVRSASVATGTFPVASPEISEASLLTADLGRLDAAGRLHLVGRAVDFVKIHGHRVHPGEIEAVIRRVTGVRDVVVVAQARSDVVEGLRAVVAAAPEVDREEILRACEASLPSYKIPRSIELRAELPRTSRGKLDRSRL